MPRIDLTVPFKEKDEAKRLGARWDAAKKVWFVPHGVDPSPLRKWAPPSINIRASSYYIAEATARCWKCTDVTQVFGIALPAGYEVLEVDEEAGTDVWERMGDLAMLSYIEHLPDAVQAHVCALTPNYRLDFSKTTNTWYWMNHCAHCGIKQGDNELFHEPDGAFLPMTPEGARAIKLLPVSEPFEAAASYVESDVFH